LKGQYIKDICLYGLLRDDMLFKGYLFIMGILRGHMFEGHYMFIGVKVLIGNFIKLLL